MNACCADRWVVEQWSACSKTCGKLGYQTRVVQCMQAQNNGTNKPVHSKHCTGDRPDTRRACNQTLCPAQWRTGAWSQVSTHTGPRLATVLLITLMLNKHYFPFIVFRNLIRIQLLIQNFNDPDLLNSPPPRQCSVTCGEGIQQRQVVCKASDNAAAECEGEKPETIIICKLTPCLGKCKIRTHDLFMLCSMSTSSS